MKKITLLITLFLLIGCSKDETQLATQNNEPKKSTEQEIQTEIAFPYYLIQLNNVQITLDLTMLLEHQNESFEYPVYAEKLTLINKTNEAIDLSFLKNFSLVDEDFQNVPIYMTLNTEKLPSAIAAHSVQTVYLQYYYPSFGTLPETGQLPKKGITHLQLTHNKKSVHFKRSQAIATMPYEDLNQQSYPIAQQATANTTLPTYQYETLIQYECPKLTQPEMICKGDTSARTIELDLKGIPTLLYYEQDILQLVKLQIPEGELLLYFNQGQTQAAALNGRPITITEIISICAAYIIEMDKTLSLLQPLQKIESERSMYTPEDIEHLIQTKIRPTYEQIEKKINAQQLTATHENNKDIYTLEKSKKTITSFNGETYSALTIDEQLYFILHVDKAKQLTRYYFDAGQLVRILHPDQSIENATPQNFINFNEIEQQLLDKIN